MRLTGEDTTWRLRRSGQGIGGNTSMWHHRDQGRGGPLCQIRLKCHLRRQKTEVTVWQHCGYC